jgi:pimeloyl-ACP methyl ester carboxylesterase
MTAIATIALPAMSQPRANKQTSTVTASDGVSVAYEMHGNGSTALVFVHGWSCDRSYWKHQIQIFAQRYKVVTVDLGGHGESGTGRKDWTIASFGRDVAAVVNKLGLKHVVLIGHSMGGDVIADAALQLPGRVAGLIMVDTYKKLGAGRTPESVQAFLNKFRTSFVDSVRPLVRSMFLPTSDSSLVEYVARDMSSAPPAVALSSLESSFTHSRQITHDFELLELPVIALNPDNEPTDTASMQRYKVEVMIMPGVGHFLMMEEPKRFNELLSAAIKKMIK